jgi:hypothetical protein
MVTLPEPYPSTDGDLLGGEWVTVTAPVLNREARDSGGDARRWTIKPWEAVFPLTAGSAAPDPLMVRLVVRVTSPVVRSIRGHNVDNLMDSALTAATT